MACSSLNQPSQARHISADSGKGTVKVEKMAGIEMDPRTREPPVEPSLVNNHPDYPGTAYPNHSQPPPNSQGVDRDSPVSPAHGLPHGYNHAQPSQNESHIHPELRSSHEPSASPGFAPVPNMMPAGLSPTTDQPVAMSGTTTVVVPAMGGVDNGDSADGRKAKRELSQSKRAAQNRAAQRAFRQRKEGYIKKLEQQVRDYGEMENSYKTLQTENYQLREYVIHLQSRLLDAQGEYPQPPPNLNLGHPHAGGPPQQQPQGAPPPVAVNAPEVASQPPVANTVANPLEVAAQAVAGLSRSEHLAGAREPYPGAGRTDDDARTAEEITRQLQADGQADALPAAPM